MDNPILWIMIAAIFAVLYFVVILPYWKKNNQPEIVANNTGECAGGVAIVASHHIDTENDFCDDDYGEGDSLLDLPTTIEGEFDELPEVVVEELLEELVEDSVDDVTAAAAAGISAATLSNDEVVEEMQEAIDEYEEQFVTTDPVPETVVQEDDYTEAHVEPAPEPEPERTRTTPTSSYGGGDSSDYSDSGDTGSDD